MQLTRTEVESYYQHRKIIRLGPNDSIVQDSSGKVSWRKDSKESLIDKSIAPTIPISGSAEVSCGTDGETPDEFKVTVAMSVNLNDKVAQLEALVQNLSAALEEHEQSV